MKFYKVVSREGKQLWSCARPSHSYHYSVRYVRGKWVKPVLNNSKLFVFKNLSDAVVFSIRNDSAVYECKVKNPEQWNGPVTSTSSTSVFNFWQMKLVNDKNWKRRRIYKEFQENFSLYYSPANTYLASEVKLVRRINKYNHLQKRFK